MSNTIKLDLTPTAHQINAMFARSATLRQHGGYAAMIVSFFYGPEIYAGYEGYLSDLMGGSPLQDLEAGAAGYFEAGALLGSFGGAAGYFSAYIGNGATASLFSGALNGYLQSGNLGGAFRGALSSMVPYDLGFSSAYNSSWAANLAIREGVAFARGAIINESLRGGIQEAEYSLATEAVGFGFGYVSEFAVAGGDISKVSAPYFSNGAWIFPGGSANGYVTIGNVMTGKGAPGGRYWTHENGHATWQSALGRNYLPATGISVLIGSTVNALTGHGFVSGPPAYGAITEHAPFQPYGYECLPPNPDCGG